MIHIPDSKKTLAVVVSIIVIIVGAVYIFRTVNKPAAPVMAPGPGLSSYRSVAFGAAEETVQLIGKQGRIVVAGLGPNEADQELAKSILKDFQDTLTGLSTITIVAVEPVSYEGVSGVRPGFPADEYQNILGKYPDVDAIVSFDSFPDLNAAQVNQLPEKRPKLITVVPRPCPELKLLLERQVIQKAIVGRFTAPPFPPDQAKTNRQWFDLQWQVITPADAASLPE